MSHEQHSLTGRLAKSIKGHLRVMVIALIFGMTAYGLIHILIWVVNMVEKM